MNPNDLYQVNRGNSEFQVWENAHWERAAAVVGFHHMRLDEDGILVTKHTSAIRRLKPDTTALESEMTNLLTHQDLTADAKKLLTAAIEAQTTGNRPALEWSV